MRTRDLREIEATEALGRAIAQILRPGDAVLLEGALGAGKSTLARALLRAACRDPALDVPSPTFTLVQTYQAGGLAIHHYDLWRLDPPGLAGPDGLHELGWDEARDGAVIVEWPDRLGLYWPADALVVRIDPDRQAVLMGWEGRL